MICSKSFSSIMRFMSTEPTMPRQPTRPTVNLSAIINTLNLLKSCNP
ncbi:hypothetical protein [Moraxella lacunata]